VLSVFEAMSQSFLEHRFERKGNTFIAEPTLGAELSAEFFESVKGRLVLFDNPRSVLHRHHSLGCFIPFDLTIAWESETETSQWLMEHDRARLETKSIDRESSLVSISCASTKRSKHLSSRETKQQRVRTCTESDGQKTITTIMLQNLQNTVSQRTLMDDLERSGFGDVFDFCYVPADFKTRLNKGFAFVNFTTPDHAESFKRLYESSRRLGVKDGTGSLRVTPAAVQGLDANVQALQKGKIARIRSRDFRPYVRKEAS
jgi:hypothetical protein